MKLINRLVAYRYLIALILLVFSVAFELHGSSLANWSHFGVRENKDGSLSSAKTINGVDQLPHWLSIPPASDGTLLGQPQMIRSDEWLVQTPFYLSQVATGLEVINPSYGLEGQQMILAYNAPVRHLSIIGKPFNWGFLFLDAGRGLSWYWSIKLLGFFLLAFEFSMILTKNQKALSLLGSLWITATPAIQWWFMQHLGDIVFFNLAIMVFINHYFRREKVWEKFFLALGLTSSLIGFSLVIYPAFQVVFAYVILFFFLSQFVPYLKQGKFSKIDAYLMLMTLLVTVGVVGETLFQSWEQLQAILGTVYPGQRLSLGGELGFERLTDLFLNPLLPFKVPHFMNQVELATSIQFLPLILVVLPFLMTRANLKTHVFPLSLVAYSLWLYAYTFFKFPKWLVKLLFFHYVPGGRAWQSLSVIGVFLSIWFLGYLWQKQAERVALKPVALVTVGGLFFLGFAIRQENLEAYVGTKALLTIGGLWLSAFLASLFERKRLASIILISLITISGLTVNPLVKGIDFLKEKRLFVAIQELVSDNPEAKWISEGNLYNFPQLLGARTLNSVRFYPDKTLMDKLDPNGSMVNNWNRYAHMRVQLIPEGEVEMNNPYPDVLELQLTKEELEQLEVSYILTHRDLQELVDFQLVYGPDLDGHRIYYYSGRT